MAFVRGGIRTTNVTVNAFQITVDLPLLYEAGDTIMLFTAKDSGAGTNFDTPAGWTKLGEDQSGSVIGAVYYKEDVSASETPPTITSSDSDTWSAFCFALGGVATSGVVGATLETNFNVSLVGSDAYMHNIPGITTTAENSLVLYLYGSDGSGQALTSGNARLFNYADGVSVGAYGWYRTQVEIGSSGTHGLMSGSGEQFAGMTVEILDSSGGSSVLPYMEGGLNESNLINGFHGLDTNTYAPSGLNSGVTFSPVVTTIAGQSIIPTNSIVDQSDANAVPYVRAFRVESDLVPDTAQGVTLFLDRTENSLPLDMSAEGVHFYAVVHHLALKTHSLGGNVKEFGTVLVFHDTLGNWTAFGVDGRDSVRKLASPIAGAIIIRPDSTENVIDSFGTLDLTLIDRVSVLGKADLGQNYYTYFCNFFLADPFVILGGSLNFPGSADTIIEYSAAKGDFLVQRIGDSYLVRGSMHVGNGVAQYRAVFDGKTTIFASSEPGTHIKPDHLGFVLKTVVGGYISAVKSSWTSSTPFKFDIRDVLGTVDFSKCTVKNAQTFNIRGNFSESILTPATGFSVIDYGADITGATVDGDIELKTLKDLTGVTVSGALTLTVAGTYIITNSTIDEVINSSGGGVIIEGAGSSFVTNTGPNITINNSIVFSFNVTPSITGYEWRLYEDDPADGVIGLVELAGEEVATQDDQSYSYDYVSDKNVVLQILDSNHKESLTYFTLTNTALNRTIDLTVEESI